LNELKNSVSKPRVKKLEESIIIILPGAVAHSKRNMLKLKRFVFFLVYKKLQAVAKLLRHSPKKMDFHLKTHS